MTRHSEPPLGPPPDNELLPLSPAEELFFDALVDHLVHPASPGRQLSEGACAVLERTCPAVEVSRGLDRRLQALAKQAELDAQFMEFEVERQRKPSLGGYFGYLRARAGLSLSEAASHLRLPFQLLADLERDGLRPAEIPARRLATALRRLSGSREMAERLVLATVRAPRYRPAGGAPRLYRGASGASRAQSETASRAARGETQRLEENPDWREETEAARRLAAELRRVW